MALGLPGMDRPRVQGRNDSPSTDRPVIRRWTMRTQEILRPLVLMAALTLGLPQRTFAEDPVRFGDLNLKAAVEAELGKTNPTPTDMLALTTLNAYRRGVTDLKGLEYATNLTRVQLEGNQVSDLSPLFGLIQLTSLDLWGNRVSDASSLSGLTNPSIAPAPNMPLHACMRFMTIWPGR